MESKSTGYAACISRPDDTVKDAGFLATIAPTALETVQAAPRSTIVPAQLLSTAGGRAMAFLSELSTGSQLRPGEVLGEGGMGIVRAAEQVALGRTVAVKTLKPGRQNPGAALDLLREAWVTGSLEHPNIVPVHYLELDDAGMPTIVLKRISGVDWSSLCHDGAAVEKRFGTGDLLAWNLDILLAILDAIRFAHARGIVHRDLKPSNVMIGEFGEVYLLDWGIAVALVDDGSGRLPLAQNATEIAGTPCYMAPEMIGGADGAGISERTDVYLAGAVLFELITGAPPHLGDTALAVLASVATSHPKLPEDVPGELAAICRCAMARRPDDRFATVDAMRRAIQAYLAHRGSTNLGDKAAARLGELREILAATSRAPTGSDEDPAAVEAREQAELERREAIYRLFGACRFGFHEALAVWHDNTDATLGLRDATLAVAEYEVATGNPRAALALLGELDASPEVAALTTRARTAAAVARQHAAELEKLRAQHDGNVGRRTRAFLAGALGMTFTIAPILGAVLPFDIGFNNHPGTVVWAVISLAVIVATVAWARDTMLRATLFNRRIAMTGMYMFAAQIVLSAGAWIAGLSMANTQLMMVMLWATVTWMLAITLDRWLAASGTGYLLAFLAVAAFPEQRLYIIALANFGFAVNVIIRWRPATLWMTTDERRSRDKRRRRPG